MKNKRRKSTSLPPVRFKLPEGKSSWVWFQFSTKTHYTKNTLSHHFFTSIRAAKFDEKLRAVEKFSRAVEKIFGVLEKIGYQSIIGTCRPTTTGIIIRPPTMLQMPCKEKIPFNTSILLRLSNFKIFRFFNGKTWTFVVRRRFQERLPSSVFHSKLVKKGGKTFRSQKLHDFGR